MVYIRNEEGRAANAAYMRQFRASKVDDPEYQLKVKEFDIKYRNRAKVDKDYYLKRKIHGLKQNAKARGLEFNITYHDLEIPDICPVLGIPFDLTGENLNARVSVDRVDNSKGYVKGNVRVISNKANACKRDLTLQDVRNLLDYMEGNR